MKAEIKEEFSKYETARILGARALQIAMDAPLLLKIEDKELEGINYDPLKIAEMEFSSGVLPITVKRPFPKKIETALKREKIEEKKKEEEEKLEEKEEETIKKSGEIMELTKPEDEVEEAIEEEAGGETAEEAGE